MAEGITILADTSNPAACPVTGEVCPVRENLIVLYSQPVDAKTAAELPSVLNPNLDSAKLAVKLGEMTAWSRLADYDGIEHGSCPTRRAMDQSTTRRVAVHAVRKLIHRGK